MRLLVNCIPLKQGGGLRVGRTFVQAIGGIHLSPFESVIVVCGEGFIDDATGAVFGPDSDVSLVQLRGGRFRQEVSLARTIESVAPDVVYTPFGPSPMWCRRGSTHIPSLAGFAYSNLVYPEVPFWRHLRLHRRLVALVKDRIRMWMTLRSDVVACESEDMRHRAIAAVPYRRGSFITIRPSVNPDLVDGLRSRSTHRNAGVGTRVVMLSGYHPNKNWHVLPEVLLDIERRCAASDIEIVLCERPDHPRVIGILRRAEEKGVAHRVKAIGAVPHAELPDLLGSATAVMLLSELESFSNNVLEAWASHTALVLSDRPWARSEAGSAALYCDPDCPGEIADRLLSIESAPVGGLDNLIFEGSRRLARYPSAEGRAQEIIAVCAELGTHQ